MKTVNVHGVSLTTLQEMKFYKFISNKGIAMNTLSEEDRRKTVETWMKGNNEKISKEVFEHITLKKKS